MKNQNKTIEITDEIYNMALKAIKVAVEYEKLIGRSLGITGEIGEILACRKLGLKLLQDPISAGYDAVDKSEKSTYQIKTRRIRGENFSGVTGRFSEHDFDYAALLILDRNYKPLKLCQANYVRIKPILEKRKRKNLTIKKFISISTKCIDKFEDA